MGAAPTLRSNVEEIWELNEMLLLKERDAAFGSKEQNKWANATLAYLYLDVQDMANYANFAGVWAPKCDP